MNVKKKGILKGFKYFSQIFDEEESKEIQIGMPTDVKHVAHIGWDGPSANAPSWMDEFKSTNGGYQSAPLDGSGSRDVDVSEAKGHKSHASNPTAIDTIARDKDMPTLPKATRRHQSMDSIDLSESPPGSPTGTHHKIKQKDKDSKNMGGRRRKEKSSKPKEASGPSAPDDEAPSQSVPSIPKKSRRKKSKDPDASTKSSSKSKQSKNGSIAGSEDGGSLKSSSGMAALEEEE